LWLLFQSDLNFTFTVRHECTGDHILPGSVFNFHVDVISDRDQIAGPFTLEAPIPSNVSDARFAIVGGEVTSKGANVPCVPVAPLPLTTSDWYNNAF